MELSSDRENTTKPNILFHNWCRITYLWCFLFYQEMCILFKKMCILFKKNCILFKKSAILCLLLKNVSPSKGVVCFILNNLNFPMVECIAFYVLYKSRVLIIPCKADDLCLFIGLPNVSPSKGVVCVVLNNLHFPMVEGIAFYALYKSKVLLIPCKADDLCLFIGLPNEI